MQNRQYKKKRNFFNPKWFLPLFLVFLVFFDGSLMLVVSNLVNSVKLAILPNLTLLFIFYIIRFDLASSFNFYLWVGVIGFIFDLYYTQAFGTYIIAFLFSAFVMNYLDHLLNKSLLNSGLIFFGGVVVFYFIAVFAGLLTNVIDISLSQYFVYVFLPTAVFNLILEYLLYMPISWVSYEFI
ncbi:MAG: rod shape-determining protein MreD [Lactobacillaceae bacterium]|jgi:rod shape-determining protein MreD|nr:rod shape-determining protein MreD [Lactobacillaceae bacterium]